jgi:hypothetical protein
MKKINSGTDHDHLYAGWFPVAGMSDYLTAAITLILNKCSIWFMIASKILYMQLCSIRF